jgi:hypothetical protein
LILRQFRYFWAFLSKFYAKKVGDLNVKKKHNPRFFKKVVYKKTSKKHLKTIKKHLKTTKKHLKTLKKTQKTP